MRDIGTSLFELMAQSDEASTQGLSRAERPIQDFFTNVVPDRTVKSFKFERKVLQTQRLIIY